jgi:hypothetical protein
MLYSFEKYTFSIITFHRGSTGALKMFYNIFERVFKFLRAGVNHLNEMEGEKGERMWYMYI